MYTLCFGHAFKPANVDLGCYNVMECTPCSCFFSPVVFSMQLSIDSQTMHHRYISPCFRGKHFVPFIIYMYMQSLDDIIDVIVHSYIIATV